MIAKLTGTIDDLKPTGIVLCVAGVGYELSIPFSTYEQIKGRCGVTLHVHTYHREDSLRLFGFYSAEGVLQGMGIVQQTVVKRRTGDERCIEQVIPGRQIVGIFDSHRQIFGHKSDGLFCKQYRKGVGCQCC